MQVKLGQLVRSAFRLARRVSRKPPSYIASRAWRLCTDKWSDHRFPQTVGKLNGAKVAKRLGAPSAKAVLDKAAAHSPFPIFDMPRTALTDQLENSSKAAIRSRATQAMRREVKMMGSGLVKLGTPIDWHTDFKSGVSWPLSRISNAALLDLGRPSDIKVPWELSRLQWLLPVAQAYMIDRNEKQAAFARSIIEEWIAANPICRGPNWICAMDVALRAVSICWIFLACRDSEAWQDEAFLERLVVQIYQHAAYTERFLEWSDVAGNHLTTDLAGLVVLGIFLGNEGQAKTWAEKGWAMLMHEFPMQVPDDGVCREASVPYHRLVGELFLLPALARKSVGLDVPNTYWARLATMADFIDAYVQPGGSVPIWGDADDGRALPLGSQGLNDHRYLSESLRAAQAPPKRPAFDETFWWLGCGTGAPAEASPAISRHFDVSGVVVMRNDQDHVFIDAGPVGMAGRGGHGHNDCLAFEAVIAGTRLIIDPGSFVYSADWKSRNKFRGTAVHNTPFIDNVEINKMPEERWLWYLENNAIPDIRRLEFGDREDVLTASHAGYSELDDPVTPVRTIRLIKHSQCIEVSDQFEGIGKHQVQVTYTFAPDVHVLHHAKGAWSIRSKDRTFLFQADNSDDWSSEIRDTEISPSYGVIEQTKSLVFLRTGHLKPLKIKVMPAETTY